MIVVKSKVAILCSFALLTHAADKPTWAKGATVLWPTRGQATPQRIASPDGHVTLQIHPVRNSDRFLHIHVSAGPGHSQDIDLDEGAHELLWAPDSTAFLVNGSTTGYAGFFTTIYQFGPGGLRKVNVAANVQRDMVASFPPCAASNHLEAFCAEIERHPEFNISGLSWIGPFQVVVMAEVPCVSTFGGIMCQVQGYVLSVPDGRILVGLTARQLKTRWQRSMAWSMRIPDPPAYGRTFGQR